MGKYDAIFTSDVVPEDDLTADEGIVAIAYLTESAFNADSTVDVPTLSNLLWQSEILGEASEEEISELLNRLDQIAQSQGTGGLFNLANDSLGDEDILDAYAIAVMMVATEDGIDEAEMEYLGELQEALEISDEESQQVIEEILKGIAELAEDEEEEGFDAEDDESLYVSPVGNFTVAIPVDPESGGRMQDEPGTVGFSDDFGKLFRIDYFQQIDPQAEDQKIAEFGAETYLKSLLDSYVSQAILEPLSGSSILSESYLEDLQDGAYFMVVDMPKGATISVSKNGAPSERLDAYRGIIVFIQNGFSYVISCQRVIMEDEAPNGIEEEAADLQEQLENFIDTMEFMEV